MIKEKSKSKYIYCWICHQDEQNRDTIGYYKCKCTIKRQAHIKCLQKWHVENQNDKCSICKERVKRLRPLKAKEKSIKVPQQTYIQQMKGDRELFFDSNSSSNNSSNIQQQKLQEQSTLYDNPDYFESSNVINETTQKVDQAFWQYCQKK